jgi:3',5'-cyclic AMP phosphodiesterase CpdA
MLRRMRIALTSDLHVDHHPEVVALIAERVRRLEPDVLVVAGDVSSSVEHVEAALAALRPSAPHAVFVPGNHDLWCLPGAPTSRERYEEVLPARVRAAGFVPLGRAPVELPTSSGPMQFVGVTGWYDYSLRNRDLDATFALEDYQRGAWGRLRWNDKLRIVWPGEAGELDDPAICRQQVALLEAQLAEAGERPTVVVTHHLPFAELVTSKGEPPWDFLNGFMGSSALGAAILRSPGVRLALSGHTHFRKSARLDGAGGPVRAEVSPIGYPSEYSRAGLDLVARVAERVTLVES